MAGLFVTKSTQISFPPDGLTICTDENGQVHAELRPHICFDTCPTWVSLAFCHAQKAREAASERLLAWETGSDDKKASTIEREFEESIQAIVAAATAIEAFYAKIKTFIQPPSDSQNKSQPNRTPRYKRVAEVLRRGFNLPPAGVATLRSHLKVIYEYRNLTVHPQANQKEPLKHPELGEFVEWRFIYFCATYTIRVVNIATGIICDLTHHGKPKNDAMKQYLIALRSQLLKILPNGHPLVASDKPEQVSSAQ